MSDRPSRRVDPWERRRLAGIFSAFQALLFFARRQAARSKTRPDEVSPPKTRLDEVAEAKKREREARAGLTSRCRTAAA